ncbi:hypothetical protein LCGC14_2660800, partial [marine sediment metagenome]
MLQQESEFRRLLKEMEGLTAPIIFHPGGWADSVPQEIRAQVPLERLALLLRGEWDRVTDAELVCYLFTYSLAEPITSDWTAIYAWVVGQWRPDLAQSLDIPEHLTGWQMKQLQDLKRELRQRQRKFKKETTTMAADGDGTFVGQILMDVRAEGVTVGMVRQGCDPISYYLNPETEETIKDRAEAQGILDLLVEDAQARWAISPRGKAFARPAAAKPGKATPAKTTTATPAAVAEAPPSLGTQLAEAAEAQGGDTNPAAGSETPTELEQAEVLPLLTDGEAEAARMEDEIARREEGPSRPLIDEQLVEDAAEEGSVIGKGLDAIGAPPAEDGAHPVEEQNLISEQAVEAVAEVDDKAEDLTQVVHPEDLNDLNAAASANYREGTDAEVDILPRPEVGHVGPAPVEEVSPPAAARA